MGITGSDLDASKNYICTSIGQLKWLGKSFYWCGCIPLSVGTSGALVNVSIQHLFRIQLHMALLDGAVSQLLVELPRTVKGQNGVEFDFQSI